MLCVNVCEALWTRLILPHSFCNVDSYWASPCNMLLSNVYIHNLWWRWIIMSYINNAGTKTTDNYQKATSLSACRKIWCLYNFVEKLLKEIIDALTKVNKLIATDITLIHLPVLKWVISTTRPCVCMFTVWLSTGLALPASKL